jgi:hypothetical protein
VRSGAWPYARLVRDAPVSAHAAQHVAARLTEAAEQAQLSYRDISRRAGVSPATLNRIITGSGLCDTGTLARLEHALHARLWPESHAT